MTPPLKNPGYALVKSTVEDINSILFLLLQLCKAPTVEVCGVWSGWQKGGGVGVGIKGFYVCNKDSHTNKTWKKQATKTKMTIRAKAMLALNEQSMTKSLLY